MDHPPQPPQYDDFLIRLAYSSAAVFTVAMVVVLLFRIITPNTVLYFDACFAKKPAAQWGQPKSSRSKALLELEDE